MYIFQDSEKIPVKSIINGKGKILEALLNHGGMIEKEIQLFFLSEISILFELISLYIYY